MRLVLGMGGTAESFRALTTVLDRVDATGDDLVVAVLPHEDSAPDRDEIESRVAAEAAAAGVDVAIHHLSGEPGPSLVEFAESEGFDAIAIGGGEQSPMGKIRLGSITEFVVLNASVSVYLVR